MEQRPSGLPIGQAMPASAPCSRYDTVYDGLRLMTDNHVRHGLALRDGAVGGAVGIATSSRSA